MATKGISRIIDLPLATTAGLTDQLIFWDVNNETTNRVDLSVIQASLGDQIAAANVSYDNTNSTLLGANAQTAIDELDLKIESLPDDNIQEVYNGLQSSDGTAGLGGTFEVDTGIDLDGYIFEISDTTTSLLFQINTPSNEINLASENVGFTLDDQNFTFSYNDGTKNSGAGYNQWGISQYFLDQAQQKGTTIGLNADNTDISIRPDLTDPAQDAKYTFTADDFSINKDISANHTDNSFVQKRYVDSADSVLQSAIDGKQDAGDYSTSGHSHIIDDVTGLQTELDGKQDVGDYSTSGHTHVISEVDNLQSELDNKLETETDPTVPSYVKAITDPTTENGKFLASDGVDIIYTNPSVDWGEIGGSLINQTDLQSALDGKQDIGDYSTSGHSHAISDITNLQTELDGKAHQYLDPLGAGAYIGTPNVAWREDSGTVYCDVSGDFELVWYDTEYIATPINGTHSVALVDGTSEDPQENYVYFDDAGVLRNSINYFGGSIANSDQFAPIARFTIQDAATVAVSGPLKQHNYTDHIASDGGRGHLSHINERIRQANAEWFSGVAPSINVTTNGGAADNVLFSNTAGYVFQMHSHTFPAFAEGSNMFVANDFTAPYTIVTDLNQCLTDLNGDDLSDTRFSLVIWGVQSENDADSKLFINLPKGSYNSDANAIVDINNYSVFSIPEDFKGTAFLIARVVLRHRSLSSGTWELLELEDLRGLLPAIQAGGGSGSPSAKNSIEQDINDDQYQLVGDVVTPNDGEYYGYEAGTRGWYEPNKIDRNGDVMQGDLYFGSNVDPNNPADGAYGKLGKHSTSESLEIQGLDGLYLDSPYLINPRYTGYEGAFLTVGQDGLITLTSPDTTPTVWQDTETNDVPVVANTPTNCGLVVTPNVDVEYGSLEWNILFDNQENQDANVTLQLIENGVAYGNGIDYVIPRNSTQTLYGSGPVASTVESGNNLDIQVTSDRTGNIEQSFLRLSVAGGSTGGATWGSITGTLSNQTDLQAALDAKANTSHTHTESEITDLDKYTQSEVDTALLDKPDISSEDELAGAMQFAVVASMPGSPDPNTIYFVQ